MGDSLPLIYPADDARATAFLLNFVPPYNSELMLQLPLEEPREAFDLPDELQGLAHLEIASPHTQCVVSPALGSLPFPLPEVLPLPSFPSLDPHNGLSALPSFDFDLAAATATADEPQPSPVAAGDVDGGANPFKRAFHVSMDMEDQSVIEEDSGLDFGVRPETPKAPEVSEVPEEQIEVEPEAEIEIETETDIESDTSSGKDEKWTLPTPPPTVSPLETLAAAAPSPNDSSSDSDEDIPAIAITPDPLPPSRRHGGKRRFAHTRAAQIIREQALEDRRSPPATARDETQPLRGRPMSKAKKAARYGDGVYLPHATGYRKSQRAVVVDAPKDDDEPIDITEQVKTQQQPQRVVLPPIPKSGVTLTRTALFTKAVYHDNEAWKREVAARTAPLKNTAIYLWGQQTASKYSPSLIIARNHQDHLVPLQAVVTGFSMGAPVLA